jgi:hypothetical protein
MRRTSSTIVKRLVAFCLVIAILLVLGFVFDLLPLGSSPYNLPEKPIVAMRIVGTEWTAAHSEGDAASIHGWKIVQERNIDSPELRQEVLDALNSRFSYGMSAMGCFIPGIAIRFGEGTNVIDAIICLECHRIYFYRGSEVQYGKLSRRGVRRLLELYPRLFPGRSADRDAADNEKVSSEMQEAMENQAASTVADTQPEPSHRSPVRTK